MSYRKISSLVLLFSLVSWRAAAQVSWIANASFADTPASTLYDLSIGNRPLILAVGNIHSQASEHLLNTGLLQTLVQEHSADAKSATRDIRVAFMNVHVFAGESFPANYAGVPVLNIDEGDKALLLPGWTEIYSISGTGLYVVTPDHLVYKLEQTDADAVYASVKVLSNKLKPVTNPDVRLLDVRMNDRADVVHVSVQNFSRTPLRNAHVIIQKNGSVIAASDFSGIIAPLNGAVINVPFRQSVPLGNVEIIVRVKDDANPLNNVWTGHLLPGNTEAAMAGPVSR